MLQTGHFFATDLELISPTRKADEQIFKDAGLLKKQAANGFCRLDSLVINKKLGLAVIVEMKFGDGPLEDTTAEMQLDYYTDALADRPDVTRIKRIAVMVNSNNEVQISSSIYKIVQ
jgi:hypothetical protein